MTVSRVVRFCLWRNSKGTETSLLVHKKDYQERLSDAYSEGTSKALRNGNNNNVKPKVSNRVCSINCDIKIILQLSGWIKWEGNSNTLNEAEVLLIQA